MHFVLIVLMLFGSGELWASDLSRESEVAEQLKREFAEGDRVKLQATGSEFIALQKESLVLSRRGAVILLHGLGGSPDERGIIHTLRTQLPESGWNLLSVQMPIGPVNGQWSDYQGLIAESAPRIGAAVAYLKQTGVTNVVLVGHGLGGAMALNYLSNRPAPEVKALVMIGLTVPQPQRQGASRELFEQMARVLVPQLDLYGSRDLPDVRATAQKRLAVGRKSVGSDYRQSEILGADHQFRGLSQMLLTHISKWIARVAPGSELPMGATNPSGQ